MPLNVFPRQQCQWGCNASISKNKPAVVVGKPQERSDVLDTIWGLLVMHCTQLLCNWSGTLWRNPLTKELDLVDV